ncbi:hypothetical protein K2173_000089 [Erythroxylum novogranatense]|uniref:Kinetochore protein Spc24 n=1 Tax=Erythroxylum novogranatense TaxID=1862640 RepID=A0AAV8SNL1_9ROSI|nr:hypothetical protein K2173_000089 [Erythroxylum novogranatense]
MGDLSGKIDLEKLISYSDDLVAVLKDRKDIKNLTHCLEHFKILSSSSNSEYDDVFFQLQDYEKKIDEWKQKTEKAESEVGVDGEPEIVKKELEAELEKERALMEELRVINDQINDLERQRICFEAQKQHLKKLEQDELRLQRKLSMYASVTNVIPNLDDRSKISGHIVDRDKKKVEMFEFDPSEMSAFDTCQTIWKMINLQ